jgi:hypothetical protein
MPTVYPLTHKIVDDGSGNHFAIARIQYSSAVGATINVPGGLMSAACLVGSTSATAPTVGSITAGDSTVTLSSGDSGVVYLVSRHVGSAGAVN